MANAYESMTTEELDAAIAQLEADVERLRAKGLSLDMARGKPSPEQVDLSRPMLDALASTSDLTDGGVDAANYGCPDGLPSGPRPHGGHPRRGRRQRGSRGIVEPEHHERRRAARLGQGRARLRAPGAAGAAWPAQVPVPSPGYDRHFAVSANAGFENVPVAMGPDGPDMDEARRLVEGDPAVKGIWSCPSTPTPRHHLL